MVASDASFLEVLAGGLLTTIQDRGRFDHRDEGVPVAGACDPIGLAVANLIIGNAPAAAALECTILGPELLVLADGIVGLGGADLGAMLQPGARPVLPGSAKGVRAGDRIVFGERPLGAGCRAYLAVPGGIDVPVVLGSRSTSLVGAFGGLDGRPLRSGDRLARNDAGSRGSVGRGVSWKGPHTPRAFAAPIRVLPGPALTVPGSESRSAAAFLTTTWRVAAASDRRGLRLDGPPIRSNLDSAAPSHGVLPGTIQVTPSGQPLVLLNDAGTTGGYPVIGVVIAADLWRLGQARPGATLQFEATTNSLARAAALELRDWLATRAERLAARSGDAWDDLADDAGG